MERYQHDGLTFEVRDSGPRDGDAVVLLHGFPQDGSSWDLVVPALQGAGLRTLVPDQRGYSPRARPKGRAAYKLELCAGDVLAMMDAAGVTSAHVVAHDWGGAVAWLLAGRHPARVRSVTVLSTPHPAAMFAAMRTSTQALKSWYMLAFQLPWLPERLMTRGLAASLERSGLPSASARRYAERLDDPRALTGALNWYRAMPWSRSPAPRSGVPTTYVWGRHDPFLGRAAAERTAEFVTGDYRFVELDAGHWLPEKHADKVAQIILARVSEAA